MKTLLLLSLLVAPLSCLAESAPWFRGPGEYIANRSLRVGLPTETAAKVLLDGKRFDVTLGKRLPLLTWNEEGAATAWTAGIDAGMLASLQRYNSGGRLTFATNTFDGFFGAFLAKAWDGWLVMGRFAHLSAHLVDNSPNILMPLGYSQFWEELVVGKTFPSPEMESDWELHLQGSLGLNHTSTPAHKNPRAAAGASFGHSVSGPGSLAVLASADMLRAGVDGQRPSYAFFLGMGTLNRPGSTIRPFRAGVAHLSGSDYRNQNFNQKHQWTTIEVSTDF
jgi:hypothetical protein